MNKEQELNTQLKQAIKGRDSAFNLANEEIKNISEQIAKEKLPPLRHGDYGFPKALDSLRYALRDNKTNRIIQGGCDTVDCRDTLLHPDEVVGNFVDDLQGMQEDVTEFEIDGDIYKVCGDLLQIKFMPSGGISPYFHISSLPAIAKKLNQVYHTHKRKQAKA